MAEDTCYVRLEILCPFGNNVSVWKSHVGLEILRQFRDRKHTMSVWRGHILAVRRLEILLVSVSYCVILKYCVGLEIGNTISV